MTAIVTRESLTEMLTNPSPVYVAKVIGRALVALLQNQTDAEKRDAATEVDNGIGFTGADAYSGTLTAKYFMKHGTLAEWQILRWTKVGKNGYPRLAKYHAQLNKIAMAKVAKS